MIENVLNKIFEVIAVWMIMFGISAMIFTTKTDYQIPLSLPHFDFIVLGLGINLLATMVKK